MSFSIDELINGLACSDNTIRRKYETVYEDTLNNNHELLLTSLSQCLGRRDESSAMVAILFRRAIGKTIDKKSIWSILSPQTLNICKSAILESIHINNKTCDIISEIIRIDGDWPEIFNQLDQRGAPKELLKVISENSNLSLKYPNLLYFIKTNLKSGNDNIDSVRALCSILVFINNKNNIDADINHRSSSSSTNIANNRKVQRNQQISLFRNEYNLLFTEWLSNQKNSELDDQVVEELIALAGDCPKVFKPILSRVISISLENLNLSLLELLVTLIEGLTETFKKNQSMEQIVRSILLLIAQIDQEGEGTDEDLDDSESISGQALQALDRISMALEDSMAPLLFNQIPIMLEQSEYRIRYAGLMAMAYGAEGCIGALETQLTPLLSLIWPMFRDSNPRVAYAACHVLGQLCTDFNGLIQKGYTLMALENLVGLLLNSPHVKVQSHAAAALVNFSEGIDQNKLKPFLNDLIGRLIFLLQNSKDKELQEQLLATIAAFASAAGRAFIPFLDALNVICMSILFAENDKVSRLLQCRAIEALTLIHSILPPNEIASATRDDQTSKNGINNTTFDYKKLLDKMVALQESIKTDDDPMKEYLTTAWQRMNSILKEGLAAYLPICLPPLIEDVKAKVEMFLLDSSDDSEDYDPNDWIFTRGRTGRLGIKTSMLDAKSNALVVLCDYAENPAFSSIANEIYPEVMKLTNYELSDEVQASAAYLLTAMIEHLDPSYQGQVLNLLVESLLSNPDLAIASMESISTLCLRKQDERMGDGRKYSFDWNLISIKMTKCILHVFKNISSKRNDQVDANAEGQDFENDNEWEDEDEGENDDEEDDDNERLCYGLGTLLSSMVKLNHSPPMPLVDFVLEYSMQDCHQTIRHASICMLVDMMPLLNDLKRPMEILDKGITCKDDLNVLQASVYGIGMSALIPSFSNYCISRLTNILSLIESESHRPSYRAVIDNVVSAAARIFTSYPHTMTMENLNIWLKGLPISMDEEEFVPVLWFIVRNKDNIMGIIPDSKDILLQTINNIPREMIGKKDSELLKYI